MPFNVFKKDVVIKRENWKGKYVWAARYKGRMVTFRRAGRLSKKDAVSNYKNKGTFRNDRQVLINSNTGVKESTYTLGKRYGRDMSQNTKDNYIQQSSGFRKPRTRGKFQYSVTITLTDGSKAYGRSQQYNPGYPLEKAREEAILNAFARLTTLRSGVNYDDDAGEELFREEVRSIKEEIVTYSGTKVAGIPKYPNEKYE